MTWTSSWTSSDVRFAEAPPNGPAAVAAAWRWRQRQVDSGWVSNSWRDQLVLPRYRWVARRLQASSSAASAADGSEQRQQQQQTFANVMAQVWSQLTQAASQAAPVGAHLCVRELSFQPAGAPAPLLSDVTLELPPNELGLVFGRSGSGKTTLLQLLSGLAEPSGGAISFSGPAGLGSPAVAGNRGGGARGKPSSARPGLTAEQCMAHAGLVFQFPERHFVGRTLVEELTLGWPLPLTAESAAARQALGARAQLVLVETGLSHLPLDVQLASLSDGYKR